jgi:hypothetical protein
MIHLGTKGQPVPLSPHLSTALDVSLLFFGLL